MKRCAFVLVVLFALLASPPARAGEQRIYLEDGSVLQGTVLAMDEQRVLLATAFDDSLEVPRSQIKAILLAPEQGNPLPLDPTAVPDPPGRGSQTAFLPAGADTIPGTLEIAIKGDALKSSVRFRDREERPRMEELNRLYLRIYLDGRQIYEESDSTFEKEFRERQDTYLRNQHRFKPVTLKVPAGVHDAHIVVGNKLDLLQEGENQSKLVSAEIVLENLQIHPAETTRVVLQGKGSRWGYGKYELKRLSTR